MYYNTYTSYEYCGITIFFFFWGLDRGTSQCLLKKIYI